MNQNIKTKFPSGFYWGAATSAHQVEGGNVNDWSRWEKENAERLAKKAGKHWKSPSRFHRAETSWQKEKFPEMLNPENYISGSACDHYNRYEEDFDIAKKLGHNAHRFSIEWSRIEPEEGKFNQKEIDHYRDVIRALKQRNLEPFVTLWHFTCPTWFADKGGWLNRKAVFYFTRYVEKIVSELGSDVKFWITLNEPVLYAFMSYLKGDWPPQIKMPKKFNKVVRIFVKAHRESYKIIKDRNPLANVGIAKDNSYFSQFVWWCPFEWLIVKILKYIVNESFLNKINKCQDFVGLNYYFHREIGLFRHKVKQENKTDMGWEICPEGIYHVLKDLKKYDKPVYILENGIADADNSKREKFIEDHLIWVRKAMDDGVDVRGYFHWSLLDNFEWDKGFWPKFGLVRVCKGTLDREIKGSVLE